MKYLLFLFSLCACASMAATTNRLGHVVMTDGVSVFPPGSLASHSEADDLSDRTDALSLQASSCETQSLAAAAIALQALDAVRFFSPSNIVTSTVYVRSIGGVPFNASNQTVRTFWGGKVGNVVTVIGVLYKVPLIAPVLDWRYQLTSNNVTGGSWLQATNVVCSFPTQAALPSGATNGVAYTFSHTLSTDFDSAFFRVTDNSTGISGDGYWWLVYGGITVDGKRGLTADVTNSLNQVLHFQGGVLSEAL